MRGGCQKNAAAALGAEGKNPNPKNKKNTKGKKVRNQRVTVLARRKP
jgi:hypothetical protein